MGHFNPKLLEELIEVQGTSGDEKLIRDYLLNYIETHKSTWKNEVKIYSGDGFQDAIILVFGQPKTAVFAHIDTIGFTVGYEDNLMQVGSPRIIDGTLLVGEDSKGVIETELMVIDEDDGSIQLKYVFNRAIDRGTPLSFKPNFKLTDQYVQSPYLDNRLGVLNALNTAKTLKNGAIVFSTYEEHGGGSVGFLGKFLFEKYGIHQALISDITWVTDGVQHNGGVAISLRDKSIPRRSYLDKIISIAEKHQVKYQLEVESSGGSDGSFLQASALPIDWCFIGAPEDHVHSPKEKVFIHDIEEMMKLYVVLMEELNG